MKSRITYHEFKWTKLVSQDYYDDVDYVNEAYRKMLTIGKAPYVFRKGKSAMLFAETKKDFCKTRKKLAIGIRITTVTTMQH